MVESARILITGASGASGHEVIHQLTARGIAIRAFVRNDRQHHWGTPLAQEAVGDLDDIESLERAMVGIEKVFAITGLNEAAVPWFANVVSAARQAKVRQLVRFSALGADRTASAEILRQHGEADALLLASGLAYTILRPNAFFQHLLRSASMIKTTGRFVAAVGDARLSFVDVRDLAEAVVRVLTEPNHERRIYALTGVEPLSYRDLARELTSQLGRPIVYHPVTPDDIDQSLRSIGLSPWSAHAIAELQSAFATGAFAEPRPDLSELLARRQRRFSDFVHDSLGAFQ